MIELYILVGVTVFVLGLIGYGKILKAKAKKLEAENANLFSKVAQAEHEVAQKVKTETTVARVGEQLRVKHIEEQAAIDQHQPRTNFESTDF